MNKQSESNAQASHTSKPSSGKKNAGIRSLLGADNSNDSRYEANDSYASMEYVSRKIAEAIRHDGDYEAAQRHKQQQQQQQQQAQRMNVAPPASLLTLANTSSQGGQQQHIGSGKFYT